MELTPRSKALVAEREDHVPHGVNEYEGQAEDAWDYYNKEAAASVGAEIAGAALSAATERVSRARPEQGPPSLHLEQMLATELLDSVYGDALKLAAKKAALVPAIVASELVSDAFMAEAVRIAVVSGNVSQWLLFCDCGVLMQSLLIPHPSPHRRRKR